MKNINISARKYAPGDIVGNTEIISMLGIEWDGDPRTFWRIQLKFRDLLENHLRKSGVKATCRIAKGGTGVEVCTARRALDYQIGRRRCGVRKVKRAHDGLEHGVDTSQFTPEEIAQFDREQRITVNRYLAVKSRVDFIELLKPHQ